MDPATISLLATGTLKILDYLIAKAEAEREADSNPSGDISTLLELRTQLREAKAQEVRDEMTSPPPDNGPSTVSSG